MTGSQCTSFNIDVTADYFKGYKIGYNSTGIYWINLTSSMKTVRLGTEQS